MDDANYDDGVVVDLWLYESREFCSEKYSVKQSSILKRLLW
jgi:hypothetical protein